MLTTTITTEIKRDGRKDRPEAEYKRAAKVLEAAGYQSCGGVMTGDKGSDNFGDIWVKFASSSYQGESYSSISARNKTVYLNYQTLDSVLAYEALMAEVPA